VKKLALILLMMLPVILHAQDIIQPYGGVEVSLGTDSLMTYDGDQYALYEPLEYSLQVDIHTGVLILNHLDINGSMLTKSDCSDNGTNWLDPYQAEFWFGVAYVYKTLEIGMKHSCFHPIKTLGKEYLEYYGGGTRFYGSLSWR